MTSWQALQRPTPGSQDSGQLEPEISNPKPFVQSLRAEWQAITTPYIPDMIVGSLTLRTPTDGAPLTPLQA